MAPIGSDSVRESASGGAPLSVTSFASYAHGQWAPVGLVSVKTGHGSSGASVRTGHGTPDDLDSVRTGHGTPDDPVSVR
ncbi:hypothetical protein TanjilG_05505 [Lupinus angustifolius]|uniref:Uncharacterized protein n=1 Tax=Lupinus angustifolius TaxID=3871 RepID=A0A1J7INX2_LUPAN|nr:hypothetical protein TanjilG_05505 [Lupinus angustifolius]